MQNFDVFLSRWAIFVDADDNLLSGINAGLRAGGGFLDSHFGNAGVNGFGHSTKLFNFSDMVPGLLGQVVSEVLDIITAAPSIDDMTSIRFLLQK